MIVSDLQAVQSAAHGERGIGRYVADLAEVLVAAHPDAVDVFAWNDRLPRTARLDALAVALGERLQPFSALRGVAVDVLHVNSPFEPEPWATVGVPVRARRTVVTCFDLIPYRFPDVYLTDPAASARYRTRLALLTSADAVVTDSRSAASDVVRLLGVDPRRVTSIGGGAGDRFVPPATPLDARLAELRRTLPALSADYVLVPAGADWRKNLERTIEAFGLLRPELRQRYQFVIAAPLVPGHRAWLDQLAAQAGCGGRLLFPGEVDDATMVLLYQSAELVLFPSLYEGFGLPVLEARRCGARVLAGAAAAVPEVLPDARALFDPWSAESIATHVDRALTNDLFASVLARVPVPAELTWPATAERLVAVYRSQSRPQSRPRMLPPGTVRDRPRIAFVTLLEPTPSGIADHSARLLAALTGLADVTAFVQFTATARDWPFPVHDLAQLYPRWLAGEFDTVVYAMGNYFFHRDFLDTMRRVPGHAILHDVRQRWAFDPDRLAAADAEFYGGAADDDTLFVRPVAAAAQSLLVQSQHAADLIAADLAGWDFAGRIAPVVNVGPHPSPPAVPVDLPDDGGGPPWVVALGIAHESKQTGKFVEAARILLDRAGRGAGLRVALVGLGGGRFTTPEDRRRIIVTEHVSDTEFNEWLHRAAVLVQLRGASNGESSGVLARAWSAGIPAIASNLGSAAEAPDDILVKVPVDITPEQLADEVEALLADGHRRAALSAAGKAFAAQETYAAQAARLIAALRGPVQVSVEVSDTCTERQHS